MTKALQALDKIVDLVLKFRPKGKKLKKPSKFKSYRSPAAVRKEVS